ncbi:hypothetical protein POM88_016471 [Heracleum sosnowskyi]|uniref:Uncharacterized protein n=1 Tax=Heracleum sosnowskyi TaxID=360622 RepID=A0AAD8MYG9_9APIA|nr:hypothetical protein POM88_016471 [Heracleum sosnowskyi]
MRRASPSSWMGILNKIKMKRKTGETLKKTLNNVLSYLRSDSYMYSSLIWDKSSDCFSVGDTKILRASKGGMKIERRAKSKKRFLHKIVDYLKSDCYMYAPLVACSGKRRYGKKSSPRSTLVRNTLAFRREEKCLINPVGRSSSPSGGSSKRFRIAKANTIWTGEELFKIMKDAV